MADIRDRMQQLEQQRQTAQRDIQRQAREAQERARADRSRLEQERQKLLEESRKRQAQLERQRFAPTTDREEARKEIEETEKQREEIEQKAGEVEKEIKEIQKDIEQAEKAAGQEVEKEAQEIKGELETAAAQIKEFEESHIKLDYIDPETKEPQWVSKETWNELEPEQQNELKELGVEKFNELQQERIKEAEAEIAEYEANTIELDYIDPETNEPQRVDVDMFASLDPEQQAKLKELGVEEYNKWVESQNVQANWDQLQDLLDAGGISTSMNYSDWLDYDPDKRIERYQGIIDRHFQSLSTGEIVPNKVWKSLEPEQQKQLNELGIDGFNKLQEQESWDSFEQLFDILEKKPGITRQQWAQMTPENRQEIYETHLNANFVKLKAGGYYPKTPFNEMPTEEQDRLNKLGVEGYNDYLDKNFYPVQGGYLPKDFIDGIENKEHRDYILKNGLESYQDKYLQKLDNGEWLTKDTYDSLSPEEKKEINRYGVEGFQKRQEERLDKYFNELPPAAKEWVSKNSREAYLDIINNAGQDKKGFEALKAVGIMHPYAEYKGVDKEGNFEYTIRRADLKNIDFNNLTGDDFWLIVEAVKEDYPTTQKEAAKYITPFGGTGKIYDKRTQASIDKWLKTLTPSQREAFIKAEKKAGNERFISILSFVFPPARALREDVTIKDITGIEWAMGVANVGLMVVAPGLGAAGKIGGTIGKVAQVAGKTVQAAATITYPSITLTKLAKGEYAGKPLELALDLGIDMAILIPSTIGTFKALRAKLDPKGTSLRQWLTNEAKANKSVVNTLTQVYSDDVARAYTSVSRAESKYIQALSKAERLKGKVTPAMRKADNVINKLNKEIEQAIKKRNWAKVNDLKKQVNKALDTKEAISPYTRAQSDALLAEAELRVQTKAFVDKFAKAQTKSKVATKYDSPEIKSIIENMPDDIIKSSKQVVSQIYNPKSVKTATKTIKTIEKNIKKLSPKVIEAEKKLQSMYDAYKINPTEINKKAWKEAQLAYEKLAKQHYNLKIEYMKAQAIIDTQNAQDIIVIFNKWQEAKNSLNKLNKELANLAKQAKTPSNMATTSILKTKIKEVTLKVKNLKNQIEKAINRTEVAWAKDDKPIIVGKGGTATIVRPSTGEVSTSLALAQRISGQTKGIGIKVRPVVDSGRTINMVIQTSQRAALLELHDSIREQMGIEQPKAVYGALAQAVEISQPVTTIAQPIIATKDITEPLVQNLSKIASQAAQQSLTSTATEIEIKQATKIAVEELVKTSIEASPAIKEQIVTKVEPVTQALVKQAIKITPKTATATKIKPPIVKLPDDTEKELTEEELEGAIAWKQGFMYILIFPPYGEKNIAYSKKPFPGVRTVDGAQSAFITATRIGGKVPEKLARKLGFFDLKITTPKGGKPKLKYTRRIGKTEYEGEKTLNAAIKGAK